MRVQHLPACRIAMAGGDTHPGARRFYLLENKDKPKIASAGSYHFSFAGRAFESAFEHALLQKYNLICVFDLWMLTSPITSGFRHFAQIRVISHIMKVSVHIPMYLNHNLLEI
jgi:hypothetical protein